jgi:hypothetical protein
MMKTEYIGNGGFLQRDGVEHKEYAEACSTEIREVAERDGADLLEKVLDRDNLNKAYKRVKANKGACGVDGMTIEEALPWLKEHREELLESIRSGKYKPAPVRRVEIPKDNGGKRQLGIPTVIDRIIQQAIAQVLMYIWKQWKLPRTRVANLKKLGMPDWMAYRNGNTRKGYWAIAGSGILQHTMRGWLGYYGIADMKNDMERWNEWLRRRIRMYIWKQWKLPRTRVANLKKLGMPDWMAYRNGNTRKGYWAIAGSGILQHTITNERLARRGYYDISEAYKSLHSV